MKRLGTCDGKEMLQLLRNCSGAFLPGVLTALVGSSGAGKTTLMDCLAGRKTSASHPPSLPSGSRFDKHRGFSLIYALISCSIEPSI